MEYLVTELLPVRFDPLVGDSREIQTRLSRMRGNTWAWERYASFFLNDEEPEVVVTAQDVIAGCRKVRWATAWASILLSIRAKSYFGRKFNSKAVQCYHELLTNERMLCLCTRPDMFNRVDSALGAEDSA